MIFDILIVGLLIFSLSVGYQNGAIEEFVSLLNYAIALLLGWQLRKFDYGGALHVLEQWLGETTDTTIRMEPLVFVIAFCVVFSVTKWLTTVFLLAQQSKKHYSGVVGRIIALVLAFMKFGIIVFFAVQCILLIENLFQIDIVSDSVFNNFFGLFDFIEGIGRYFDKQ